MKSKNIFELLKSSFNKELAKDNFVIVAYLFGSFAKGNAGKLSDVDVAVLIDYNIPQDDYFHIQIKLINKLEKMIKCNTDVVILNSATPELIHQVIKYGKVIYQRSFNEKIAFEGKSISMYLDIKPFLDFHQKRIIKKIKEEGLGT